MVSAAEKGIAIEDAGINLASQSLRSVSPRAQAAAPLNEASFGATGKFRVSAPAEENVNSAFLSIFNQETVRKMWLAPGGAHVTLSEGANGQHILRVIDTSTERKGVASHLTFDQKPTISIAPDGKTFMVSTGDIVAEYSIEAGGVLKARHVHQALKGEEIIAARYKDDRVVISSRRVEKPEKADTVILAA